MWICCIFPRMAYLKDMHFFERFMFIAIGLVLICAGLLGAALYHHFSRYSPNRTVAIATISIYGAGLIGIVIFVLAIMYFG